MSRALKIRYFLDYRKVQKDFEMIDDFVEEYDISNSYLYYVSRKGVSEETFVKRFKDTKYCFVSYNDEDLNFIRNINKEKRLFMRRPLSEKRQKTIKITNITKADNEILIRTNLGDFKLDSRKRLVCLCDLDIVVFETFFDNFDKLIENYRKERKKC